MSDVSEHEGADSKEARLLREEIEQILRRVDALREIDPRSPDELLGYGEDGV